MKKQSSYVVVSKDDNGVPHNETGHAVEISPSTKIWYYHGLLHRVDGPAYFNEDNSYEEWWLHGKRHRVNGPAIKYPDGKASWWVNGVEFYSEETWFQALTKECQINYIFEVG